MVAAVLTILSMAVLTWKGATAKEALGSELLLLVPAWAEEQGFADNPEAVTGRRAVRAVRLPELPHLPRVRARATSARPTSLRSATTNDAEYFVRYLTNPAAFGNNVMGSYSYLGQENLEALGAFLEASKGAAERRPT